MDSGSTFGPQVTLSNSGNLQPAPTPAAPLAPAQPPIANRKAKEPSQRSIVEFMAGQPNLTQSQLEVMKSAEARLRYGLGAEGPMLCQGLQCPFIGYCDLQKAGIMLPVDEKCPIEQYMIAQWRDNFLASLEYDTAGDHSPAIKMLVEDMVSELVVQSRILKEAGKDPRIERPVSIGVNFKGDPVEVEKLNPGIDLLIRVNSSKLKILKELLATPKAKSDAGRLQSNDAGTAAALAHKAANKIAPVTGSGPKKLEVPIFLPKEPPL